MRLWRRSGLRLLAQSNSFRLREEILCSLQKRDANCERLDGGLLMAGLVHDRETDPRYDELLSTVEASSLVSEPDSPQAVNAREIRRTFDRQRRMPRRLVEEWARATAHGSQTWAEARKQDDFKMFAPSLEKIFALAPRKADALGYAGEPYDARVEDYERVTPPHIWLFGGSGVYTDHFWPV
jgi:Zn-dependent M32 family carboxypeptidase